MHWDGQYLRPKCLPECEKKAALDPQEYAPLMRNELRAWTGITWTVPLLRTASGNIAYYSPSQVTDVKLNGNWFMNTVLLFGPQLCHLGTKRNTCFIYPDWMASNLQSMSCNLVHMHIFIYIINGIQKLIEYIIKKIGDYLHSIYNTNHFTWPIW